MWCAVSCAQVPTYLLERKLQLAAEHEARMAAKAAAAIPPGTRTAPGRWQQQGDQQEARVGKGMLAAQQQCQAPRLRMPCTIHSLGLADVRWLPFRVCPPAQSPTLLSPLVFPAPRPVLLSGLRRMPEAERLETLALLQQNWQEVEAKLSALPITVETHSMVRQVANDVGRD